MEKKNSKSWINGLLNTIHGVILAVLLFFTARAALIDANYLEGQADQAESTIFNLCNSIGISELFTFIGAIAFVLFGLVGIYEFSYYNGIRILVPPFFLQFKEQRDEKLAENLMRLYYENDIDFIREYEKERIGFVLQSLGLDEAQFHHISYELVKARAMPAQNEAELAEKAKKIIYQKKYIVDQSMIIRCDRVYQEASYFINLYTALYDSSLCSEISRIMASYILLRLQESKIDIKDIDYIVVPCGGNLLFGLEVGKILRKRVVSILNQERIRRNEFWDGNYECLPGHTNHIIIINDVLVTGDRIYKSVARLTDNTYIVEGLFCLVKYNHDEYHPEAVLKDHNILNINCLVGTSEKELERVYKS